MHHMSSSSHAHAHIIPTPSSLSQPPSSPRETSYDTSVSMATCVTIQHHHMHMSCGMCRIWLSTCVMACVCCMYWIDWQHVMQHMHHNMMQHHMHHSSPHVATHVTATHIAHTTCNMHWHTCMRWVCCVVCMWRRRRWCGDISARRCNWCGR